MVNISIWLRAFRPPLQRAFTCPGPDPDPDETDAAFAALLRLADQRARSSQQSSDKPPDARETDTDRTH
jgi:hypothetical protein